MTVDLLLHHSSTTKTIHLAASKTRYHFFLTNMFIIILFLFSVFRNCLYNRFIWVLFLLFNKSLGHWLEFQSSLSGISLLVLMTHPYVYVQFVKFTKKQQGSTRHPYFSCHPSLYFPKASQPVGTSHQWPICVYLPVKTLGRGDSVLQALTANKLAC